jgi:riboflavin kinase/FMN adenylyltransferase
MPQVTALTIGNFDGVHVGHAALIRRARELAGTNGRVVAMAFDPHPMTVLRPEAGPERLTSFARRAELLVALGADEVVRLTPEADLLSKPPKEFIQWAVDRYHPQFIVEGDDFHFGRGRAGNVRTLATLGQQMNFTTDVVGPVEVALSDQLVVRASSSIVRWLVSYGRMSDAALVLGRSYELEGAVIQGDRRGREIGFPTANLSTDCLLPADGVYAGWAQLPSGDVVAAAINVGNRPTFNGEGRRLEAHFLGTSPLSDTADYGWTLRVHLIAWLRDDLKFESVSSLVDQIRRDCDRVRHSLAAERRAPHLTAACCT